MNVILTMEIVHKFVLMLKVVISVPAMMDIHYILMEGVVLVYILTILCMSDGFKCQISMSVLVIILTVVIKYAVIQKDLIYVTVTVVTNLV